MPIHNLVFNRHDLHLGFCRLRKKVTVKLGHASHRTDCFERAEGPPNVVSSIEHNAGLLRVTSSWWILFHPLYEPFSRLKRIAPSTLRISLEKS